MTSISRIDRPWINWIPTFRLQLMRDKINPHPIAVSYMDMVPTWWVEIYIHIVHKWKSVNGITQKEKLHEGYHAHAVHIYDLRSSPVLEWWLDHRSIWSRGSLRHTWQWPHKDFGSRCCWAHLTGSVLCIRVIGRVHFSHGVELWGCGIQLCELLMWLPAKPVGVISQNI